MTAYRVPFTRPCLAGREIEYVADAAARGHAAGDGPYTRRASEQLERLMGVPRALLTTSCTHALDMAALLLELGPGDEVIVPSFTFVSVANAVALRGARPVFADARPDTLNLDETRLEERVTPRTRAVFLMHYAGVACEMDAILAVARRHGLKVVEDNAHGLLGRYRGRSLGSLGDLATQSFHETKNFHCGEGGALVVNDSRYLERAEIVREKGTDRSRFFRGQVDKYTWRDLGSSYLPSDLLAAFLCAQLEGHEAIQAKRRELWEAYHEGLSDWARRHGVGQPVVPEHCEQPYHLYYLLLPTAERRDALIAHLRAHGIQSAFHYLPLHLSAMGCKLGGRPGDCPVTEDVSGRLLRLPFWNDLGKAQREEVMEAVREFDAG
jgi:dTDP-4-amino-4,6-dideoxygalactose transaminase